jgi:hypothetical protein
VAWHKAKYVAAFKRLRGDTLSWRIRRAYYKWRNIPAPAFRTASDISALYTNREVLINLRVIADSRVDLTNRTGAQVYSALNLKPYKGDMASGIVCVWADRETIFITAPPKVLPEIEALVLKADVPE